MASNYLIILVTLSFFGASIQDTSDNTVEVESSPILDAISSVLQEQTGENVASMVENFIQGQGSNILGQALSSLGTQNGGQILEGLGSLLSNQGGDGKEGKGQADSLNVINTLATLGNLAASLQNAGNAGDKRSTKDEGNNLNVLELIGNIAGSLQNTDKKDNGGIDAAGLLQGLGGLLAGGQNGQGGMDASAIGSLINMFAQPQDSDNNKEHEQPKKMKNVKKATASKKASPKKASDEGFDMGQILSLAQNFLGGQKGKGSQQGFMQYIPMIMQTLSSFTGSDAEQREKSHHDHSWKLPPFLEKIHLNFDHFMNSEMGKLVIETLGAEKSLKVFQNDQGKFDYQKFADMMENRSFRRHWIKLVTERMMEWLNYIAQPDVYRQYIGSGQFFVNGYLKSQGFPKSTFFDPKKPVDSISAFVNYVAKKYFEFKIQSREYVQPIVEYAQDLFKLAQTKRTGDSKLSDKLTDTINLELIEPLARVNRAFRFAKSVPKCTRYVFCLVNENNENEVESLPKTKQMLYQGSSLLAAWFLSNDKDIPFWTLYTDITEPSYCKRLYKEECHGFHLEELKTSTEYVHSEL